MKPSKLPSLTSGERNLVGELFCFSTDLIDFEKPAKIEEMVREVERMRAKAAKRPPLRVVQGGE